MSDFPDRIKSLRIQKGITQRKLANYLNVSQNAVYNWETGKREPNSEMIEKIANYFNITPAYLMEWENKISYRLGGKIRNARIQLGLSQRELGEKSGISQQHIEQYETGKRIPKRETIRKIAYALNVDIDDLADTSEQAIIDINENPENWGIDKNTHSKNRIDHAFKKLNTAGKKEAAKRVEELTELPRYTKPDEPAEE